MTHIRPITAEDLVSYHRCLDVVCREGRYLASLQAPPIEKSQLFVREQVEEHRMMFVAVAGEEVVGWCDIMPMSRQMVRHRGELGMAVHPDHRRRGIGERLISTALKEARAAKLGQVELSVRTDNTIAIALYRRKGFEIFGTTPRALKIDEQYFDCHEMALRL